MSSTYQAVLWSPFKRKYDAILWLTIILYLVIFIGFTVLNYPSQNIFTTVIRAFGTLAILLLHVVLLIGPLSRISNKMLPILYNRRHLGVSMFIIALVHSLLSLLYFHGNGDLHPLLSLFTSNLHYNSLVFFPFQTLGFLALIILAVMAFTSHDFWLHFLSPKFWKIMHMMVYVAYGLVLLHVALGIIQFEKSPLLVALLIAGLTSVTGLHMWAAFKENRVDKKQPDTVDEQWIYVCNVEDIADSKAKIVIVHMERVAIFKYDGKLSAVNNVCKHQMGPLGEGEVVNGCITCPWHGYQYKPEDGCAPAPHTDKLATYRLQLDGNKIYLNKAPLPEGTYIEPVLINDIKQEERTSSFFIGWAKNNKQSLALTKYAALAASLLILITGIVLSYSQQGLTGFIMDFSNSKKLEGWLSITPVPNLKIIDGKDSYGNPAYKTILLMDAFKFGADSVVKNVLNGDTVKYVRLKGHLSRNVFDRDASSKEVTESFNHFVKGTSKNLVMEIENGKFSFELAKEPVAASRSITNLGMQTLRGEIIDPKCYFGAMNPGYGKTHLSCAVRCISGGIMPVLKYEVNNQNKYAILVGLNGEKINEAVLNFIGVPVEVKGSLSGIDNWGVLKIDAKNNLRSIYKY